MSDTPIADHLKKLDTLPEDEFTAGITAQNGDIGAKVEGQKDLGKPGGWSFAASATWMKKKGYEAVAALRWRKEK